MKLPWRKNKPVASPAYSGAVDIDDDIDDDVDDLDELLGSSATPAPTPAAGGPVMLTLTTRGEIEKAAERAANPQPVRRRMERGMFGGAAGGHEHGGGGGCSSGGCGC